MGCITGNCELFMLKFLRVCQDCSYLVGRKNATIQPIEWITHTQIMVVECHYTNRFSNEMVEEQ